MISKNEVLGYKPDLNIYSRPDLEHKEIEVVVDNIYDDEYDLYSSLSSTSYSFISHLPHKKIRNLNNLLKDIRGYKEDILNDSIDKSIITSIVSGKEKEEANFDDIEGSTDAEVYIELDKLDKQLEKMIDEFVVCFYGKDADYESLEEIDEELKQYIIRNEEIGSFEKINYFSLVYDAQLSQSLDLACSVYTDTSIALSNISDSKAKRQVSNDEKQLLEMRFTKNNKELSSVHREDELNLDNASVHLHNTFLNKYKANRFLNTFSNSYLYGDSMDLMQESKVDFINDLDETVDNCVKSLLLKRISCLKKADLLTKKRDIRSFF